jgi:hypothetical protein
MDQVEVLKRLRIGRRVAEEEVDELAQYFVETDQFRRILEGEFDIIFGPKGAGKSAMYASVLSRADELFDKGIVLTSGENPRGTPAFTDIVADPPTTEIEFIGVWKLYILSLVDQVLSDYGASSDAARSVHASLVDAGLARADGGLRGLVRRVREYVAAVITHGSLETGLTFDPGTGMPLLTAKITLDEPSSLERQAGKISVDHLLRLADEALSEASVALWVLFDRLDVAFADSRVLEANALRSLFKVYLDMLDFDSLRLKIFLRSDIWKDITAGGFREASHITRSVTISWTEASLLNLVVRRLLQNESLKESLGVVSEAVLSTAYQQRYFFDALVPDQIDSGRNPKTFEWMLGRVKDGTGAVAPRELIHLLTQARDEQLAMFERGETTPEGSQIFTRQAFRDALPEVSRIRLEQTLFAEYPDLKEYLVQLEREKTNQSPESLAEIWKIDVPEAGRIAALLVEVGFFEIRGRTMEPDYWVPFLYRPALKMVQGSAD